MSLCRIRVSDIDSSADLPIRFCKLPCCSYYTHIVMYSKICFVELPDSWYRQFSNNTHACELSIYCHVDNWASLFHKPWRIFGSLIDIANSATLTISVSHYQTVATNVAPPIYRSKLLNCDVNMSTISQPYLYAVLNPGITLVCRYCYIG